MTRTTTLATNNVDVDLDAPARSRTRTSFAASTHSRRSTRASPSRFGTGPRSAISRRRARSFSRARCAMQDSASKPALRACRRRSSRAMAPARRPSGSSPSSTRFQASPRTETRSVRSIASKPAGHACGHHLFGTGFVRGGDRRQGVARSHRARRERSKSTARRRRKAARARCTWCAQASSTTSTSFCTGTRAIATPRPRGARSRTSRPSSVSMAYLGARGRALRSKAAPHSTASKR